MEYSILNFVTFETLKDEMGTTLTFNTRDEAESALTEHLKTVSKSEKKNYTIQETRHYKSE